MKRLFVFVLSLAAVLLLASLPAGDVARASSPGTTSAPLMSCADFNGDGTVAVGDIGTVVGKYGTSASVNGSPYSPLYDIGSPVGSVSVGDIGETVADFGDNNGNGTCPRVDTEIARATRWGLREIVPDVVGYSDCDTPSNGGPPATENTAQLHAIGYFEGSTDVPGQGHHWVKFQNWDGVFDPCRPEGLVYHDNPFGGARTLAAQLYVTDGGTVGWGAYTPPPSWPPPTTPHGIGLENDVNGPQCNPACSWAAPADEDGWHLHYYLCTFNIGTASAAAIPGVFIDVNTDAECNAYADGFVSQGPCPVPVTTGDTPCYRFSEQVGWMGHLYNHIVYDSAAPGFTPVAGNPNGRFADCFPDAEGWKDSNCPA